MSAPVAQLTVWFPGIEKVVICAFYYILDPNSAKDQGADTHVLPFLSTNEKTYQRCIDNVLSSV